jgi:hypothetical protein
MLLNEDTLELKYKKGTGISAQTVTVCHENNTTEFVPIYPETTVKGLIQALENKKHFQLERLNIVFLNKTLNPEDSISSQNISDGVSCKCFHSNCVVYTRIQR